MLHIVTYNFPPDTVPAAHRPSELVRFLKQERVEFKLYSRHGCSQSSEPTGVARAEVTPASASRLQQLLYSVAVKALAPVWDVDKAAPWAILKLPEVWLSLVVAWLRTGRRPDIWVTAPLVSNLYLGGLAAILSGARLHVDLRDVISGLAGERMPFFTRLVLRYATTFSVVTPSIASLVSRKLGCAKPAVIYNGVSGKSIVSPSLRDEGETRQTLVTHIGALYGGDRPHRSLLGALRRASELPAVSWRGVSVVFVGREGAISLEEAQGTQRFSVRALGAVEKDVAARMSAASDVNVVLVGASERHRRAIPLKVFDLLGAGRPILYHGPRDSDVIDFFRSLPQPPSLFTLSSDAEPTDKEVEDLANWLEQQPSFASKPISEPSASAASQEILGLICSANRSGSAKSGEGR